MQVELKYNFGDLIKELQNIVECDNQTDLEQISNIEHIEPLNEPMSPLQQDLKSKFYDYHIENSQGILTNEKIQAFEGELFRAIQLYFAETPFQTLKEAIVHHKAFCARTGKKVHLNFAQLGETCGLSESQARNAFETVKQQRLDFLEPEVKRGLLERIRQLWETETAEDFAIKRKTVLEQVEKEFRFADQHSLNYKAVTNVMNYQINKLKAK
ncbi:Hypothetical_protein [Hexamita inflata]|uniref:Hypothetical_protein n=1 Tax=Hexamita inflata TaxID=28002 RepID=A0AA86QMZ3_9EUKA|nr:Hypothetical protein HINF_LOCUS50286 [Hexamita inflata]